jgi:hypothetical protein
MLGTTFFIRMDRFFLYTFVGVVVPPSTHCERNTFSSG